jgi:Protein of unknown function (DUF3011)
MKMQTTRWKTALSVAVTMLFADAGFAQSPPPQNVAEQSAATQTAAPPSSDSVLGAGNAQATSLTCTSQPGGRTHCPADTSAGVALMKSTGPSACLLGKTWGYDSAGVWVADGCGGEFQLGQNAGPAQPQLVAPPPDKPHEPRETWVVQSRPGFPHRAG